MFCNSFIIFCQEKLWVGISDLASHPFATVWDCRWSSSHLRSGILCLAHLFLSLWSFFFLADQCIIAQWADFWQDTPLSGITVYTGRSGKAGAMAAYSFYSCSGFVMSGQQKQKQLLSPVSSVIPVRLFPLAPCKILTAGFMCSCFLGVLEPDCCILCVWDPRFVFLLPAHWVYLGRCEEVWRQVEDHKSWSLASFTWPSVVTWSACSHLTFITWIGRIFLKVLTDNLSDKCQVCPFPVLTWEARIGSVRPYSDRWRVIPTSGTGWGCLK